MSSAFSGLAGIAERSVGEALAFGLGFALGRALEPAGVALAQEAWTIAPIRAPDAGTMAEGVAQGQVDEGKAAAWAKEHGYDETAFAALVDVANVGPALGAAYQAWRRGHLTDGEFTTALKRTGLEERWYDAMRALKDERLDMGAIATAIHRGILRGQGLIIAEPPQTQGMIPHVPQSPLDPVTEAAAHGYDAERLRVLVGNTGLPPGLMEMMRLLNMGKATEDDVRRAISQSNLRNEYMDAALYLRRQLLTPHNYAEAALRGWITPAEMHAGAALHGMEAPDVDLLFKLLGRPIVARQIVTGLARGGKFGGDYAGVPEPYKTALRESNVRPEWGNLAYANRYTYPSAFVLRALAQSHELTRDEVHELLLEIGWRPDLADKVATTWAGGTAAKADPHVAKAQTQLWTTLHRSYLAEESEDADAQQTLTTLGVAQESQATILALWKEERALRRRQLTPSQIKKAYKEAIFPREVALTRLEQMGYSVADATTLLDE